MRLSHGFTLSRYGGLSTWLTLTVPCEAPFEAYSWRSDEENAIARAEYDNSNPDDHRWEESITLLAIGVLRPGTEHVDRTDTFYGWRVFVTWFGVRTTLLDTTSLSWFLSKRNYFVKK